MADGRWQTVVTGETAVSGQICQDRSPDKELYGPVSNP